MDKYERDASIKRLLLKRRNDFNGLVESYCGKDCIVDYKPCPFLDDSKQQFTCTLPDLIVDVITMLQDDINFAGRPLKYRSGTIKKVMSLRNGGVSIRGIAKLLDMSPTTVQKLLKKHEKLVVVDVLSKCEGGK